MNRALVCAVAAGTLLAVSGCAQVRGHQGYILDPTLTSEIRPGVDNKESVTKTLGRPTFVGQFDQNDWYYVSRSTRQLAFAQPRATEQTVLRVRFDASGAVTGVEQTGLEKIASINPSDDRTPTLGRERGFFQELFGNIGRVGAPGTGGASPNGGGPQ